MTSASDPTTGIATVVGGRSLADWVPVVVDRIFERCGARRVFVFGSVVRGEARTDSDIDLLVVLATSPTAIAMPFGSCAN
jgi:predicted nucleotidyltransferase